MLAHGFILGTLGIADPCVFGEPFVRRPAVRTIGLTVKHGRGAEGRSFDVSAGGDCPSCLRAIDHKRANKRTPTVAAGVRTALV